MLVFRNRQSLGKEIALFILLLIAVLPLIKLAMRWYMYIPAVFFCDVHRKFNLYDVGEGAISERY